MVSASGSLEQAMNNIISAQWTAASSTGLLPEKHWDFKSQLEVQLLTRNFEWLRIVTPPFFYILGIANEVQEKRRG